MIILETAIALLYAFLGVVLGLFMISIVIFLVIILITKVDDYILERENK